MILSNRKPIPVFFMFLSVLYFIYVAGMGNSRMIGDEMGGDPGGMVLPLFLSLFMFIASVYLLLTDKTQETQEKAKMGKPVRGLFILTLIFSIAYILLIRSLGFILCTCILLFYLCFANMRGELRLKDLKTGGLWLLLAIVFQVAFYSMGRLITRWMLMAGRTGVIPVWMGNPGFVAFVTTVALMALCVVLILFLKKPMSAEKAGEAVHSGWLSALIAVISTELLYLVFRQLFFVDLARGLITW
jgi:hypothetical protein